LADAFGLQIDHGGGIAGGWARVIVRVGEFLSKDAFPTSVFDAGGAVLAAAVRRWGNAIVVPIVRFHVFDSSGFPAFRQVPVTLKREYALPDNAKSGRFP
jgi:hypothetical protein